MPADVINITKLSKPYAEVGFRKKQVMDPKTDLQFDDRDVKRSNWYSLLSKYSQKCASKVSLD